MSKIDRERPQGRAIVHTGAGYPKDDNDDETGRSDRESRQVSPSSLPSLTPSPVPARSQSLIPSIPSTSRALESSDDDSGSSVAAAKAMFRYREDPKYATLAQAGSKNPCEISEGLLTPHLIHDFNRKQQAYFLQKGIPDDEQVPKSLACFMENREADKAIDNHRDELVAMDWAQFMKWLKENLLEENWENKLLTELVTTKMKQGVAFKTHSNEMVFMNRLLEGTKQHQNDTQLRTAVTSSLPSFLHTFAFDIVADSYEKWAIAMRKQIKDDENWGDRLVASNMNSNVASIIQGSAPSRATNSLQPAFQPNHYQSQQQPQNPSNAPYRSQNQYSNQYPNQNYQNRPQQGQGSYRQSNNGQQIAHTRDMQNMNNALAQPDYPPRLTPDERYWVDLYRGCYNCRRFDIPYGHQARTCDTPEHLRPRGSNYQLITEQTALKQGKAYIPNHGPPRHSPVQRSPSAPPPKRAKPTASVISSRPFQQFDAYPSSSRQTLFTNAGPVTNVPRRISGPRRVSSENGRARGGWDDDSDEGRPNVSMPVAVLEKTFKGERDSDEDEDELSEEDQDDESQVSAIRARHLRWRCLMAGPKSKVPVIVRALIDDGSFLVLIRPELVDELGLPRKLLEQPEYVAVAFEGSETTRVLREFVDINPATINAAWFTIPYS
ncbi:hypothetical protein C8J56DRAFT_1052710 [Mycena floridula]|nr:hypothetical protein C8J56DRAFT_1052710 [Mycena floridula]